MTERLLSEQVADRRSIFSRWFDVIYHRLTQRWSIGKKRNAAWQLATGSIIQHLDSDDWSGPNRMEYQTNISIKIPKKLIVGFS